MSNQTHSAGLLQYKDDVAEPDQSFMTSHLLLLCSSSFLTQGLGWRRGVQASDASTKKKSLRVYE